MPSGRGNTPTPGEALEPTLSTAETVYDGPAGGRTGGLWQTAGTPARIGAYRVERRLGSGGMGEVFLAWDERLARRVAVKRIRHDADLPAEPRERFRREARFAARLTHPAIVQVYDLVSDDSALAIVMEYVEGETLADRLDRLDQRPLAPAMALRLGCEIAEGLAAAHAAGVVHRDLKAENVILTRKGRAKILDFGLARPVSRETGEAPITREGALVGTFHAMSPEQARGAEVDARSDLFSLGALLYEMLSGVAPFHGADAMETLKRVLLDTPPPLASRCSDLPAGTSELVERLLAKDRADRPGNTAEVARRLAALARDAEAAAGPPSRSDLSTESRLALPIVAAPSPARPGLWRSLLAAARRLLGARTGG